MAGRESGAPAIALDSLCRSFSVRSGFLRSTRTVIPALEDLSLTVSQGELFGIVGPNGAGKTTTIKILTTLLLPTSGSAAVMGFDVTKRVAEVRRTVGYVFGGDRGFYDRLSALDNLRYFADLYGVARKAKAARIDELLTVVGLKGREREKVQGYSRGMRQRLHIARGLLHDPQVILLDEPTIGVDPVGARQLRGLVQGLRHQGKTVVLTTHYMFEAEQLCDRIAVVASGRLLALGTPRELRAHGSGHRVTEVVGHGIEAGHLDAIRRRPGVQSAWLQDQTEPQTLLVASSEDADLGPDEVVRLLRGVAIQQVDQRQPTLEDAYIMIVGAGR